MTKSDLPFGSEFSPSQIDLPGLLKIAQVNEGNIPAIEAEIKDTFFAEHGGNDPAKAEKNQRTLAMNCRLGLQGYGILDSDGNLTTVGTDLIAKKDSEDALYKALGRNILLNLNGMRVIQCAQEMMAAGESVTLETMEDALRQRGMSVAKISRHLSSMRLWLEKAGVVASRSWQIDVFRLKEILGTDPQDFAALADLSPQQRAFLRALSNTGTQADQAADGVRDLAESVYGVSLPRKSFAGQILKPLEDAGWIRVVKTTTGRGAKSALVAPSDRVQTEIIDPLLEQLSGSIDAKLLDLLRKPLADILKELDSTNTYTAGLALEALAFRLMRLLDMTYLDTRLRAEETGGAEVDLIFESARLVFSRWQIQCKNYKKSGASVRVDDVAKEVGLTHMLKSNVIVVVTTGSIGAEARKYSNHIMRQSNLAIVLLDGQDLKAINDEPTRIIDVFRREAEHAMRLKKITPEEVIHD